MKKLFKFLLILILAVIVLVGAGLGYLTATEYRPEAVEEIPISFPLERQLQEGQSLTVLSWNIGYAGLGAESDFFMDGGSGVRSADEETVDRYLAGIREYIYSDTPDLILLQEVDQDSTRTYGIDETEILADRSGYTQKRTFAKNFSAFVPYPLPPIGRVQSGLYTISPYSIDAAERIALPCPFSWPLRIANLKRCLLVNHLPIEGSDKELVLIDLHLEAYDSGAGKIAQTKQLSEFMQSEYEKGNYVIAGGDFNQIFPGGLEAYPNEHPDLWTPGILEEDALPEGFSYAYDLATPTCRLLNQPFDPADTQGTQYYVIDGFILSPNVTLESVESVDLGFENSDHNPVRLRVTLN